MAQKEKAFFVDYVLEQGKYLKLAEWPEDTLLHYENFWNPAHYVWTKKHGTNIKIVKKPHIICGISI